MNKRFPIEQGPVILAIMAGQSACELVAEMRNAEAGGAQGIALDLSDLRAEFRNEAALQTIIGCVRLPVMCFFYRDDKQQQLGDEARQEILLSAAAAGAAMIDVMGDLYDPSPMEITHQAAAIEAQRALIERIHAAGAQVVISSHLHLPRSYEQVYEHLRALAERGGDVVKIVCSADSEAELSEAIATTMRLKRELGMPFIHLCTGSFSRPHRFLCPSLGCAISFGVHRYQERYPMPQPTVSALLSVTAQLAWTSDQAV